MLDVDSITIKEAREIAAIFGSAMPKSPGEPANPAIGRYCIVRCQKAGVHAGIVKQANSQFVELENSRRLWYWKSSFVLSDAAVDGIIAKESKIACQVDIVIIPWHDVAELLPCSAKARKSIEGSEVYRVNGN